MSSSSSGSAVAEEIVPFRCEVPEAELADLKQRLVNTRWPEQETVGDWSQGVPLAFQQELVDHWAHRYDWRRTEARLNSWPQFRTELLGVDVHFTHVRSPEPDAMPMVMTHGFPLTAEGFLDVIGPLTDPVRHGGDRADAFHLVMPSMPGFGFSDKPTEPGWNLERIAAAWDLLMARLGYDRYAAEGGDLGGVVATRIARIAPERLTGIHVYVPSVARDVIERFDDISEDDRGYLDGRDNYARWESGYSSLWRTRPQTVGYALTDSPAGHCAWIVEKYCSWTDWDGNPRGRLPVTLDQMLDTASMHWLTRSGASAGRLYWESFLSILDDVQQISVPAAYSDFHFVPLARRWAEWWMTDLRHYNRPRGGGYFAPQQDPDVFVDEVRTAFRSMR